MLIDKSKYVRDYGVKDSKVSNWMQRHWTKGLHYFVIGRTTMIDVDEVNKWIRQDTQEEYEREAKDLRSESFKTENLRTKKQYLVTHSQKVTFGGWQNSAQS